MHGSRRQRRSKSRAAVSPYEQPPVVVHRYPPCTHGAISVAGYVCKACREQRRQRAASQAAVETRKAAQPPRRHRDHAVWRQQGATTRGKRGTRGSTRVAGGHPQRAQWDSVARLRQVAVAARVSAERQRSQPVAARGRPPLPPKGTLDKASRNIADTGAAEERPWGWHLPWPPDAEDAGKKEPLLGPPPRNTKAARATARRKAEELAAHARRHARGTARHTLAADATEVERVTEATIDALAAAKVQLVPGLLEGSVSTLGSMDGIYRQQHPSLYGRSTHSTTTMTAAASGASGPADEPIMPTPTPLRRPHPGSIATPAAAAAAIGTPVPPPPPQATASNPFMTPVQAVAAATPPFGEPPSTGADSDKWQQRSQRTGTPQLQASFQRSSLTLSSSSSSSQPTRSYSPGGSAHTLSLQLHPAAVEQLSSVDVPAEAVESPSGAGSSVQWTPRSSLASDGVAPAVALQQRQPTVTMEYSIDNLMSPRQLERLEAATPSPRTSTLAALKGPPRGTTAPGLGLQQQAANAAQGKAPLPVREPAGTTKVRRAVAARSRTSTSKRPQSARPGSRRGSRRQRRRRPHSASATRLRQVAAVYAQPQPAYRVAGGARRVSRSGDSKRQAKRSPALNWRKLQSLSTDTMEYAPKPGTALVRDLPSIASDVGLQGDMASLHTGGGEEGDGPTVGEPLTLTEALRMRRAGNAKYKLDSEVQVETAWMQRTWTIASAARGNVHARGSPAFRNATIFGRYASAPYASVSNSAAPQVSPQPSPATHGSYEEEEEEVESRSHEVASPHHVTASKQPVQSAEERVSFDNMGLLAGTHHPKSRYSTLAARFARIQVVAVAAARARVQVDKRHGDGGGDGGGSSGNKAMHGKLLHEAQDALAALKDLVV